MTSMPGDKEQIASGAATAAFLAAGIGAFALGLLVILNEAGVYAAPALYGPAGGVSGRTTFAVIIWLVSWVVLHRRWNGRQIDTRRVHTLTFVLVALGLLLTLPPVWGLVS